MRKIFILLIILSLGLTIQAQDKDKKDKKKDKTEKVDKEKATIISAPEGSSEYQEEDRKELSKSLMPRYDENQSFNQNTKKKKKQQDAYDDESYYYPAKPKSAWAVGVRGGLATLNGDISQQFFKGNKPFVPGYSFGAFVKKPFSHLFSVRLNYSFLEMWNQDWEASTLVPRIGNSIPLVRDAYVADGQNSIFHNSHTVGHDATLDAVFSLNNLRYHKERTNVVLNLFVSGGAMIYRTWSDHLDENGNAYDYSAISSATMNGGSKADAIAALEAMRDGGYETQAATQNGASGGEVLGSYTLKPVIGGGMGLTFRLSRVVDLDLEGRLMFTRDDLVDGIQFGEDNSLTRDKDTYATTSVGLSFKLVGKNKLESATLLNPMHYTYQKLAEVDPESAIDDLLKDDDGDGVPNRLDQEDNTAPGAPVDPKGRALDSDKDGIIDHLDTEPFSPPGYPVDENGVAQIPPVEMPETNGYDCAAINDLPSVHFEKNKFYIRPEFYAHMHNVAELMLVCPDVKVVASGMTDKDDNEKYNEQLSWNRVNAVIDYITDKYGLERSRFIVKYEGESAAKGSSAIDQYRERKVSLRTAGSDDSGDSNPAAPHPGIKAGSDK